MASLAERYEGGACEQAWADADQDADPAEVAELANVTMARVASNVAVLVVRLTALGYRFGSCYATNRRRRTIEDLGLRASMERAGRDMSWVDAGDREESVMGWAGPGDDIATRIAEAETALGHPLPVTLRALYEHVGAVDLAGSFLSWDPSAYDFDDDLDWPPFGVLAEPFNLLPVEGILEHVDPETGRIDPLHREPDGGFAVPLANGPELSANRIGGLLHVVLPAATARPPVDPVVRGVPGQSEITLVAHLRRSFAAAGFPGMAVVEPPPPELAKLAAGLLPI